MEQPNNIDQLFRQRLQAAAVPPPEFVWAEVERRLRRRKRRAIFWLFALGLSGLGAWAWWSTGEQTVGFSAEKTAAHTPAAVTVRPRQADFGAGKPALPNPFSAASASTPGVSAGSAAPGAATASGSANNAAATTLPKGANRAKKRADTEALAVKSGALAFPAFANPLASAVEPPAQTPVPGQETVSQAQTAFRSGGVASALPLRSVFLNSPNALPKLAPLALAPIKKKAPKKCYDFHSNRQAWLFDAYTGPSFVNKTLNTGNPEYKSYVQDRLNTERRDWAFHAGVRASYLFAEHFLVRAGLHYEQFVEQFEYIDPNYIQYNISVTQKFINGAWVTVMDTTDIRYGANYVKTYNRFCLLDIPLQAALELRSGATGVSLNLGGSVNVLFRQSGSMLTTDGKPADFEHYNIFQPKVGLSLLGSIQWYYHLTPRTRVFAEPYYRHILEPVNRSAYPVDQSYGIGGVRLGLTRILN